MAKRSRKPNGGKGKQASSEPHRKCGCKTIQEHLEPLVQTFMNDIPNSVRDRVYGWESEILDNIVSQDDMASADM